MAEGIVWDHAALSLFFVAVSEELLPRIAGEVEDVAQAFAPVRVRHTPIPARSKRGHAGGGGNLKASVQSSIDRDEAGMYADVAALWYGRFMDPPARQIKRHIPFLPTALRLVVDGRDFRV